MSASLGVIADTVAQKLVEKREDVDLRRTAIFSFYGGWYCGWFQHWLYNIAYTSLFGPSQALTNAVRKVAALTNTNTINLGGV